MSSVVRIPLLSLLWLATIASAQTVSVMFKPLPLAGTSAVFGKGKESLGRWSVSVCSNAAVPVTVARERLTQAAPDLHDVPNALAEDLLTRRANGNRKNVFVNGYDALMPLAATAVPAVGAAIRSANVGYVGLGLAALQFVVVQVRKQAPNPQPYYSQFLPDNIALGAGQCGTWYVAAGLQKDAKTIGPLAVSVQ